MLIAQRRKQRDLSQGELAQRIGLSRQALSSIEKGQSVPGVDVALRLAEVLGCQVEDLFTYSADSALELRHFAPSVSGRFALARVRGQLVGYPLDGEDILVAADAIRPEPQSDALEFLSPAHEIEANLSVAGCSPALALLSQQTSRALGQGRCLFRSCSSAAALRALVDGRVHVASTHGLSPTKREAFNEPRGLVLAEWQVGLISKKGATKQLRSPKELCRPSLKIAHREAGATTQSLLERLLIDAGLPLGHKPHKGRRQSGHLGVAQAVAQGHADAGIVSEDVARCYGLHFVPIRSERIELWYEQSSARQLTPLLEQACASRYRRELENLGYDLRENGRSLCEKSFL